MSPLFFRLAAHRSRSGGVVRGVTGVGAKENFMLEWLAMNARQVLLLGAVATFALVILYVPWRELTIYPEGGRRVVTLGHALLWNPPTKRAELDTARYLVQILAVTVLAGGAIWVLTAKRFG
jgi:hypothetical protein